MGVMVGVGVSVTEWVAVAVVDGVAVQVVGSGERVAVGGRAPGAGRSIKPVVGAICCAHPHSRTVHNPISRASRV